MQRFLAKPVYSRADLTRLLNAYEERIPARPGNQRKLWNRKNTRTMLRALGLQPHHKQGGKLYFTLTQLMDVAPDLVRSMIAIDEHDAARAA
jgi:hypothetical protein